MLRRGRASLPTIRSTTHVERPKHRSVGEDHLAGMSTIYSGTWQKSGTSDGRYFLSRPT
ncbi:hypothetical protein PI125_g18852 [Phytophthora idaei]|nr:hypothetical protein PI125_g18852 [Phytophthora idaei]